MATENKAGDQPATPAAAADQPPAWFQAFSDKVEGRMADFGRDVARLRKHLRAPETQEPKDAPKEAPKEAPKAPKGQEIDHTERMASIRYSDLRSQLPPKARKRLDERLEGGMSFAAAIEQAEDLLESLQETAPEKTDNDKGGDRANQSPKLPRGKAGTADSNSTPTVTTRRELVALMKSDRAAYDRLMADPAFDPMTLRP